MTNRDHTLVLICDGQPVPPHRLQLNPGELRARALQQGLRPNDLLARQIRAELERSYTVAATEPELATIATLLIEHGTNQTRPLPVRRRAPAGAANDEVARQIADLEQRLQNALSTLQQERAARKREREQFQNDLDDTKATLRQIEFMQRQASDENSRLTEQMRELRGVAERLQDAQRTLDLVTNERDVLRDRTERLKESLDESREERDRLTDRTSTLERESAALGQQAQQFRQQVQELDRLCVLAFQQLIAVQNGRPLQISPELQAALNIFIGGQQHARF